MCNTPTAAKQPTTTQCLLPACPDSSCPLMPHCPLPCHDPAEEGRGGGDGERILITHCFLPPSPPLRSWSWHGRGQRGMRGGMEGRDMAVSQHCVGCSVLAAHVVSAYYLK